MASRAVHRRSAEAQQYRKLYNDKRWPGIRRRVFLRDGYTCQWAGSGRSLIGKGQQPNAPVAHHIEDHKADKALFFDEDNLISICKECHDGPAQGKRTEASSKGTEETGDRSTQIIHGTEQELKALRFWERGGTPKAATMAKAIRDRMAGNPNDMKDHEVANAITFGAMSEDGQARQG